MDLFQKLRGKEGPLQRFSENGHGYFTFPKLEGDLGNRMQFQGKEKVIWSINNYLGLANHPEVREADTEASRDWGLAYPMGSRMMSGNTQYHEQLERELANFVNKEEAFLVNYGYQGVLSAIDGLVDRKDVVIYDSDCHACIVDGVRLHPGQRFVYKHNNIKNLKRRLEQAQNIIDDTGGGILIVTEGVFGMAGDQGKLKEIVELKKDYNFRILVDDAHGFGTLGETGAGTGEEQGVQDEIDIYFSTFAKSMGSIGAFFASEPRIIRYLEYNTRSQIFAKSLPLPIVIGNIKRLELLKNRPELREKLWDNVNALQEGLRERGFDLGDTNSAVTPVYLNCSEEDAAQVLIDLRENYNIFCSPVVYPVVPKGILLLRLIPTAVHSKEDIEKTLEGFSAIREKLNQDAYQQEKVKS
jgi:glycine C-acetyltransferase